MTFFLISGQKIIMKGCARRNSQVASRGQKHRYAFIFVRQIIYLYIQTLKKTPKYRHCSPSSTVLLRTTRPEVLDPLLFCPCLHRCCLRRCCLCPVAAVAAVALPPPPPSPPQLPPLSSSSSVAFHRRLPVTGRHGHVHRRAAGCWSRWEVSILDNFLLNR